eukprot:3913760-Rhodomonas_salina.1
MGRCRVDMDANQDGRLDGEELAAFASKTLGDDYDPQVPACYQPRRSARALRCLGARPGVAASRSGFQCVWFELRTDRVLAPL